jgi:hypothetical protein
MLLTVCFVVLMTTIAAGNVLGQEPYRQRLFEERAGYFNDAAFKRGRNFNHLSFQRQKKTSMMFNNRM